MSEVMEQDKTLHDAMMALAAEAGYSEQKLEAMREAIAKGATLGDVLNISHEALEAGYSLGYNLYGSGNYKDAENMFRALCLYNPDDPRFWMGLAGCLQAREEYMLAIDTYGMAAVAGALQDPRPLFQGGLCYLKLGDAENAAGAMTAALNIGNENEPAHKACHDRIHSMLAVLKAEKERS